MKMSLKALIAAVTTSAAISLAVPTQAAGVPVIDVAAINQMIVDYQNQITQIKTMRDQIKAMTDNGNYAGILQDPTLRSYMNKYLPKGYNDIFDAAAKGDLSALQKVADQIKLEEQKKANAMSGKARIEAQRILTRAQIKVAAGEIDAQIKRIDGLVHQINVTTNPAQKQDLANSIMAQSSLMQARVAQMQLMFQQAAEEDKIARAQYAKENHAKYRDLRKQQRAARYQSSTKN